MEDEEVQQQEETDINIIDKIEELIDCELKQLSQGEIQQTNVDYFGKLIDMHKDIENERYWNAKKEVYKMRYNDYEGEYGAYSEGNMGYGAYGRRGVPGTGRGRRYRGYSGPEDKMEEMREHYGAYSEGRQMGNYGAKQDSIKGLENMMRSITECIEMIQDDATPEEMQIIKKYARKIGEI